MKINYYQLFDVVDEYAVEMLIDKAPNNDSYQETISGVKKMLENSTAKTKVKKTKKLYILLAATLVLIVGTMAFANSKRGAVLIDESNRHLVGKEDEMAVTIFDKEGNVVDGQLPSEPNKDVWKSSSVVKRVESGFLIPRSVTEFKTSHKDGKYITPEIMFTNGEIIIFTKEDGSGWRLKKGDTLVVEMIEYDSEVNFGKGPGMGQGIAYFQIINGKFYKDVIHYEDTLEQRFELVAEKRGEYYICIGGNSSDHISLKEGEICIKRAGE